MGELVVLAERRKVIRLVEARERRLLQRVLRRLTPKPPPAAA